MVGSMGTPGPRADGIADSASTSSLFTPPLRDTQDYHGASPWAPQVSHPGASGGPEPAGMAVWLREALGNMRGVQLTVPA